MRIALINSIRSYGGGEKRVLRGAAEFARRGHAVTVIAREGGELLARCREAGLGAQPASLRGYRSPGAVLELRAILGRLRPEVAVTYDEGSVRTAALAARLPGGPTPPLVHYFGLEGSFKDKPFNRRVVAPAVGAFVPNSAAGGDELRSFGWIDPASIHVIYDGVDPAPIDAADPWGVREELGAAADDLVVLSVARLVPEKGHTLLIDAAARLAPEFPALRVWIAGEGPEEEALRRQVAASGLAERIRLLGFRSDVPRLLRAADLFCHPSRREGAPNAVREAMVAALPVVAAAASGTPELITEGVTGYLCPPQDSACQAERLRALLRDPSLRRKMGAAGRDRALTEFSEARCAEKWLALLERCAALTDIK